jgi:hypothetical protein
MGTAAFSERLHFVGEIRLATRRYIGAAILIFLHNLANNVTEFCILFWNLVL